MQSSSLELLRGLREEELRLDDVWCDIAEVSKLRSAGLVKLNVSDKTLSLTEAGRSMVMTSAIKSSSVRRPVSARRDRAHALPPGSPGPRRDDHSLYAE